MESFGILANCLAMLPFATCMLRIFSQWKKNIMKQWTMKHHKNLSRRQTLRTSSPWLTRLLSLVYRFIILVQCMFLWLYRMYTGHFNAFCDSSHQVHTLWRCLREQMWTLGRVSLIESLANVGCTHTHTRTYMDGVQNSRSQGLYGLRTVGIEKLSLHLRYEAGPIVNHQLDKLGASIALAWR